MDGFARATAAVASARRPTRLWSRLAGCASGSTSGSAAVPGHLEVLRLHAAGDRGRGELDGADAGGTAWAPEGRGELIDVGRQTSEAARHRRGRGGRSPDRGPSRGAALESAPDAW